MLNLVATRINEMIKSSKEKLGFFDSVVAASAEERAIERLKELIDFFEMKMNEIGANGRFPIEKLKIEHKEGGEE